MDTSTKSFFSFGKRSTNKGGIDGDGKDSDSGSDAGSVASYGLYGSTIKQISLKAESAEVRF